MDSTLLHELVATALKEGADAAEAVGAERRSLSITVRLGSLEEIEREESRDLGLRVFVGQRQAVVSGSDLSAIARARLVERAIAMARLAPEDPYAGLAPSDRLARGPLPALDLYDPAEPTADQLEQAAQVAEGEMRAVDGVSNTDGASASWSAGDWRLVTSAGFEGAHQGSYFSLYASAIAGEGSGMERGGDGRSTRHLADLPAPEEIGVEAGRRAVSRLGARKIASRTAPVIFENRIATSLLSPLQGAVSGPSVARGVSFLKDKLGEQVLAPQRRPFSAPRSRLGPLRRRGSLDLGAQAGRWGGAYDLAFEQRQRAPAGDAEHGSRVSRPGGAAWRLGP
jgi:PmbA protein